MTDESQHLSQSEAQQCEAILDPKYIAGNWRCDRKAVHNGFCRQHAKMRAVRVPKRWRKVAERGKIWAVDGEIVTVRRSA